MLKSLSSLLFLMAAFGCRSLFGDPEIDYQRPSPELEKLASKPWLPVYSSDPTRQRFLRLTMQTLLQMDRLTREKVHLAGLEIYVDSRLRSRPVFGNGLSIVEISSGNEIEVVGLPESPVIVSARWSPSGKMVALLLEEIDVVKLWKLDAVTGEAERWSSLAVHAGMEHMVDWSGDSESIWLKTIPDSLGPRPGKPDKPTGAVVRESGLQAIPSQTYQGLLRTRHDVEEFEYFFTAQMTRIGLDGSPAFFGEPGIYRMFEDSPDQNYLLVESLKRPWSYLVNEDQFAYELQVWDLKTNTALTIAEAPVAEDMPYGKGMVRRGARDFEWRSDEAATVVWVEAQDEGIPYNAAKIRDRVYALKAPFSGKPRLMAELADRHADWLWHGEHLSILISWDWIGREITFTSYDFSNEAPAFRRLAKFPMGNRYRHPGFPLLKYNDKGFPVLFTDDSGKHIYLIGEGGSLEGNRPFLDRFNLESKRKERLFRSQEPYFGTPVTVLDSEGGELLVVRESPSMPPAYFLWNAKDPFHRQLTADPNPFTELAGVKRQLLRYNRQDGVKLTANLYLPADYNIHRDGPLPTLVWAYPRAYQNAENAGQLKKSPYQFIEGHWHRPILWVLKGYAVVDDPAMPIIAGKRSNPNDTFIAQLKASADALVRELIRSGVSERSQIAVGGHSYGAFMTANLLAHTDLFSAGIARSGAYNRTLTPFGFQSEERNLWQAPEVYLKMSPYLSAVHINEPLLLIHGMEDTNSATYSLQSERLFHAMNGLGRRARLVLFPEEGHAIRSRESIMHMLWEMERWLDLHVKGLSPPETGPVTAQSNRSPILTSADEASGEPTDLN